MARERHAIDGKHWEKWNDSAANEDEAVEILTLGKEDKSIRESQVTKTDNDV